MLKSLFFLIFFFFGGGRGVPVTFFLWCLNTDLQLVDLTELALSDFLLVDLTEYIDKKLDSASF